MMIQNLISREDDDRWEAMHGGGKSICAKCEAPGKTLRYGHDERELCDECAPTCCGTETETCTRRVLSEADEMSGVTGELCMEHEWAFWQAEFDEARAVKSLMREGVATYMVRTLVDQMRRAA